MAGKTPILDDPPERRVEPLRLVSLGRRWYLVGYDRDRAFYATVLTVVVAVGCFGAVVRRSAPTVSCSARRCSFISAAFQIALAERTS